MKRFTILTSALIAVGVFATSSLATDKPAAAAAPASSAEAKEAEPPCKHGHETLDASKPLDDASIYQLESRWTRSDGKQVGLADLRGKVRVLTIFYASCDYACPILVGRMKSLQAALPEARRDQVGLVLVSMDPANDTPERLAEYAERMELEGDWTLLQGQDGDVRELGALLGFRYRRQPEGGFSHSNMITVLDREGRVHHQVIGLDTDLSEAVEAITPLLGP